MPKRIAAAQLGQVARVPGDVFGDTWMTCEGPGQTLFSSVSFVTTWPAFCTSTRSVSIAFRVSGTSISFLSSTKSLESSWKCPKAKTVRVVWPVGMTRSAGKICSDLNRI